MGFQSKTYSLSDEVVTAIDEARKAGETPNRFLRRLLGIDGGSNRGLKRRLEMEGRHRELTPDSEPGEKK